MATKGGENPLKHVSRSLVISSDPKIRALRIYVMSLIRQQYGWES